MNDILTDDSLVNFGQRATGQAIGAIDQDPEEAGRAFQLSKTTGVPAPAIALDVDGFERKQKAQTTAYLINNNPYLQEYVNKHPLHAQVSNDDMGALDEATGKLVKLHEPSAFETWLKSDSISKAFWEGVGPERLGESAFNTQEKADFAHDHPTLAMVSGSLATVTELFGRPAGGILNVIASETGSRELPAMLEWLMMRGDVGVKGGGGATGPKFINEALHKQIEEALPMVASHVQAGEIPPRGLHPIIDRIHDEQARYDAKALKEAEQAIDKTTTKERSADSIEAFIRLTGDRNISITPDAVRQLYGDEVPHLDDGKLGMVPGLADKLTAAEESGADVRIPVKDWLATVEPEVRDQLRDDIRFRLEGQTKNEAKVASEQKEALQTLFSVSDEDRPYKNVSDSLMGFRKSGEGQPFDESNYKHKQGVRVTLEDTKESFEDSVRGLNRPHALERARRNWKDATIEALDEPPKLNTDREVIPDHLPQLRAASGLEPLFAIGDRKLELKKLKAQDNPLYANVHDFEINNDMGQAIGGIQLSEGKGGKELYIEMIQAGNNKARWEPNSIGPALMRDLLTRQLKEAFPNAEEVVGHRVTGARDKAGTTDLPSAMWRIKLDNPDIAQARQLFNDAQFKPISPDLEAVYKPTELLTEREHDLSQTIGDELARLIPKQAEVSTPSALRRTKDQRESYGAHISYTDRTPFVIVSLDSPHPIGTAQHEAIHHLRQQGFFTEGEWDTLARAARDGGWIDKFGIDRKYEGLGTAAKLEEAVAEGFRDWKEGNPTPSAAITLFERLQELFTRIKSRLKEIFGREVGWEELFQKVDRGEVGGREGNAPRNEAAFRESAGEPPPLPEPADMPGKSVWRNSDTDLPVEILPEPAQAGPDGRKYQKVRFDGRDSYVPLDEIITQPKQSFKDALPKDYLAKEGAGGVNLDDIASLTGYPNFRSMIEHLVAYNKAKLEANMSSKAFLNRMIDLETDRPPFARNAITSQARHDRYMKLIDKRHQEDIAASEKRIAEDQRLRQTKEWKANRVEVHKEVETDILDRPDVAADLFFGAKELYGEPVEKQKLDSSKLTEEQKASLPRDYYGKDGINPDDAARLFGFETGDLLVNRLAAYNEVKLKAGMSAKDFLKRVTDIETDRQMELRYGDLERNIHEDTREQVTSENELNILHEETYRLATEAGLEFTLTKAQMEAKVRENFAKLPVGEVSSKEFLRAAGKFGNQIEDGHLAGKPAEAFKAKQTQTYSMIYAAEAIKIEKARKQLDRTAKTFRKALIPSVEAEYTNHIQDILQRAGYKVNRSIQNIAENIDSKPAKNVEEFAQQKLMESYGLREIPVAEILEDPNFRKPVNEMTVEEFKQFRQTVDALVQNGRHEKKIIREGEAFDLAEVKGKMVEQVRSFPLRAYDATKGRLQKALDLPRVFFAGSTNMETLFNRLDRGDPRGVWNKFVSYPMAKAANHESRLQREYSKPYGELGEIVDGDKLISAPFVDPLSITPSTPTGVPWQGFTRKNVLAMLQNAGNKSNWNVLARGYGADPEGLMQWLHRNTTKEDWDRAQKMGDTIFKSIIKEADGVYERLNGITVDKIPLEPIETPFGTYAGWYHPLIADPIRKGKQKVRGGAYDDSDYGHASTANGYTKARTGTVYPLDLNFDMVPQRMKQMIHDIAFREVILETQKVFKDPALHNAITQHYGEHYSDLMMPYLKAIAGAESIPSKAGSKAAQVSEYLRQNTISTYIGFNPYTALKHGPTAAIMSSREVGTGNFIKAVRALYGQSPELGLSNSEFAMKWSEELQRRERHWQDTIAGQHKEIEGATTVRESIIEKGSWLVAQSDMLSAKPTWVARYNSAIGEGSSHGEAIDLADRAVRRAHGSTAATNQPALVRGGGALHGWLTSVYGFFGTAMQRRIEIAHKMNDTYKLGREGELKEAAKQVPGLTADIFTYVIWPTLVEEWVTGLTTDDKRGWGTHVIAGTFMGLSSSVLYLRDLAHALVTGHDPGVGLLSSPLHDVANAVRDLKHGREAFSKQRAGKTVGDVLTVFGEGTGMAPKTIANATRFGIDLVNGQSHPKSLTDWRMGITRGKTDKRVEH